MLKCNKILSEVHRVSAGILNGLIIFTAYALNIKWIYNKETAARKLCPTKKQKQHDNCFYCTFSHSLGLGKYRRKGLSVPLLSYWGLNTKQALFLPAFLSQSLSGAVPPAHLPSCSITFLQTTLHHCYPRLSLGWSQLLPREHLCSLPVGKDLAGQHMQNPSWRFCVFLGTWHHYMDRM